MNRGAATTPALTASGSEMVPPQTAARTTRSILGWVGLGLVLAVLQGIWSVSIPLMASPDEPSHVVRAAAVARTQWSAAPTGTHADPSEPGPPATVHLPSDYLAASRLSDCFAHLPDVTASCQQPLPEPDGTTVAVDTYAGLYPPLYYLLVGWPSLFLSARWSIYAMRLVSGLIAAALTVWGLYRLRTTTLPAAWTWAGLAALTPMTLFVGAMVNPQALEISSAFAFWAACLVLARSSGAPSRGTLVQVVVTGALLLNTRTSGPVWALTIVAVSLVLAQKGRLRLLWGLRPVRWVLWAGIAAGIAATAWVVTHGGAITTGDRTYPQYASPFRSAWFELAQTAEHLLQMIGNFGWLDTPSPALTVFVWIALVGALLMVSVAAAGRRLQIALLLSVLVVVAAPVVLQVPTAVTTGLIWQGRYTLPVAVGVPMVAAVALTSVQGPLDELVRRMVRWLAVPAVAAAHVTAFLWAMRRYAVGVDGRLLTRSPDWSSPLGYLTAVAIYAVPVAVVAGIAWYTLRPPRSTTAVPAPVPAALVGPAGPS